MAVVGTAYVNIRAITKKLESDVEKAFARIKDDIEVKIGADTTEAMAKIEQIIDTAEAADISVDVNADTAQAQEQIDGLEKSNSGKSVNLPVNAMTAAASKQLAYTARTRAVNLVLKLEKASVAKVAATIGALSGARLLDKYFTHLTDTMKNLDKTIMRISGWAPAIATIFSGIISGIGGIVTVAGDLTQAMGVLWAAPGVFVGFAIGLTATYIGLKDMSKVLGDLGPKFKSLGASMSAKFWQQAEQPIRNMVSTLFPQLSKGMQDVSRATGGFFGAMATGFEKAMKGGALGNIMKNVADSTDIASGSMGDFTDSFTVVTEAGAAYLPRLATWWKDLNNQFNEFINKAADDGSLNRWIEDGIKRFKEIGRSILAVSSIFGSINQAAEAAGGGGLTRLTENLEKLAAAAQTPVFQKTLTHFFAGADSAMTSVANGLGVLGGGIAQIGPQIQSSLTLAGGAVQALLTNLSLIISNKGFADGMVNMFAGFKIAIQALEPAMAPLGEKFGALMGFAGMMASRFAPVIAQAIISLAPIFMGLIDFLTPVVEILTAGLKHILEVAAPFAAQLGDALSGAGAALGEISGPMAGVIAVVVGAIAALIGPIVKVVGAIAGFVTSAGGITAVMDRLKGVFATILGPVGLIIIGLVTLYTTSEDFRNAINNLVGTIAPFIGQLVSGLLPPIMQLATSVFPILMSVLQTVGTAVGTLIAAITPLISQVLSYLIPVITQVAQTVFPALTQILGAVASLIGPIVNALVGFLVPAFTVLGAILQPIIAILTTVASVVLPIFAGAVAAIADVISGLVALITGDFQGAIDFFKSAGGHMMEGLSAGITAGVDAVITVFTTIGTAIIDFFKGLFGINSPSTLFMGFGMNLLEGLVIGIQSMIGAVLGVFATIGAAISTVWNAIWTGISTFVSTVFTAIVGFVTGFAANLVLGITTLITSISAVWTAGWTILVTTVSSIVARIVAAVSGFVAGIVAKVSGFIATIKAVWSAGWGVIASTVSGIVARISGAVSGFVASVAAKVSGFIASVKGVWSAGWNSIASTLSGVVGRIVSAATSLGARVGAAISGLISRAKSIWSAGWNAISSTLSGVVGRISGIVSGLASKVTSAISSLVSRAKAAWSAGWNAMVSALSGVVSSVSGAMGRLGSAISSGISKAVAFFTSLPGKAISALSGLGSSLAGVGRNIIQGLINGMGGMLGAAIGKVRSIGSSVVSAAKGIFGIKSPSRVFLSIGRDIMRGLDLGLNKNEILVVDRIKTISKNMLAQVDKLNDAAKKKLVSPGKKGTKKQWTAYSEAMQDKKQAASDAKRLRFAASILDRQTKFSTIFQKKIGKGKATKFNAEFGLQRILDNFYSTGTAKNRRALTVTLKDLEYARDMVETKIKTAKATLDARIKVRDDQAKQFSDRISGEFDLGSIIDKYTEAGLRPTAKNLVSDANKVLARITKFRDKLTALKRAGYSAAVIAEITNMGSEDGIAAADVLLKGTKTDIAGLNKVYKSIDIVSDKIGMDTAKAMYQTGIDSAAGLVKGLEADLSKIDKAGKKLGDRLAKSVKRALGVKSPSRVFMGIGNNVGAGFIGGIDQMQGKIDSRMDNMVKTNFDDVRLSSKTASNITNYNSNNNNNQSVPQIHVHPSAALDERAVGTIAANELGFRLYT